MKDDASLTIPWDGSMQYHVTEIEAESTPAIFCLGEEVLNYVKQDSKKEYLYVKTASSKELSNLMHNWNENKNTQPAAIFIDDSFLTALVLENFAEERKNEIFQMVPIFVFAKNKDRVALTALNSLRIDDYTAYPIDFEAIKARINVFHSLKEAGISTSGLSAKRDFDVSEKTALWSYKRLFDIIVSASCLLFISPLLILIAIAIKLESKGPIFYISKRAGKNYKVFDFYKFRSMHVDADKKLEALKKSHNQYQDGNQFVKIKNDPRITKIGNFIRNTSLDEIPQLINVLKGDMSIVGNRPLPLYEAELLTIDNYAERFLAPSGISGLWQVLKRGKGEMSSEERILLDRIYVRKNSMLFDIKIILMTFPALFQSENV